MCGEKGLAQLLILSQVVLSLQLPFAVIPLVLITRNRAKMGALASPAWLTALAGIVATVILAANVKMVSDFLL